jgi:hypothetical protein
MLLIRGSIPQVNFEPGPTLVKGDGVSEVADVGVGGCEREAAGDDAYGGYCVPGL